MDYTCTKERTTRALRQKNLFLGLLCSSLVINVAQVFERATVAEKVIVVPPNIQKEVWIKGNFVSEGYLEEWALYLTHLLLNVSKHNHSYQTELVLRHVSPMASGKLQAQFKHDGENLIKNNATTHFIPKEIVVDAEQLTVRVTGRFTCTVGKAQVSAHDQTYVLKFVFTAGRFLQLTQFEKLNHDSAVTEEKESNETETSSPSS